MSGSDVRIFVVLLNFFKSFCFLSFLSSVLTHSKGHQVNPVEC